MRRLAPRTVTLTLRSGRTIMGTQALSWPWCVRVRSARLGERGVNPSTVQPADGTMVVPRSSIEFMQIS